MSDGISDDILQPVQSAPLHTCRDDFGNEPRSGQLLQVTAGGKRKWVDPLSVEAAASVALNKGTPPDYAIPSREIDRCYCCGGPTLRVINWHGHWICGACHNRMLKPNDPLKNRPDITFVENPTVFKRPDTSDPVSASDILEQAASTIEQRGRDYNSPGGERSMRATVAAFNVIREKNLTPEDGWAFMEVLKMVRAKYSPQKIDHYLDGAAYAALAGEEALNSQNK